MTLSLDIGASNMRIAEVNRTHIKRKISIETPKTIPAFKKTLKNLIKSHSKGKPKEICVAIAGLQKNGKIINSPNMSHINGINIKSYLQTKFKTKVYVENDTHCAGLAEKHFGSAQKYNNFFLLTLGTGIGGAAFINGKLYKGQGIGMEPGQITLYNKRFETIASGPASVRLAHQYKLKVNSLQLEELANKNNKTALKVYKEIGQLLGEGILNIAYILDPEAIILGGGFSRVKFIWPEIKNTLHKCDLAKRKMPIFKAKFGVNAGLIGAALLPKLY